ncbi:dermonecrotic toxin domain-containing protein [Pseudomonas alabamensis]|uniref:dermonecrotic toxin domain-containing protein n=1 Tax=Pseudomonas alabamensis TaxID=3064349 RepID=UPI003F64B5EF
MTPLQQFEALDRQVKQLLALPAGIERSLNQQLALWLNSPDIRAHHLLLDDGRTLLDRVGKRLLEGTRFTAPPTGQAGDSEIPLPADFADRVETFCQQVRQAWHTRHTQLWTARDARGLTCQARLVSLRREYLDTELRLRRADETLDAVHERLLRTCLEFPHAWQRQQLPLEARPQLYKPLLEGVDPNWRQSLPGTLVLVQQGPEGRMLEHHEAVGVALLCSLSHGIEAFASLAALHQELCERLEDPIQSAPLLALLATPQDRQRARQASRLRYDWHTGDMVEAQVQAVRDAQHHRAIRAWQDTWRSGLQRDVRAFDTQLKGKLRMVAYLDSRGALATRYALLLEKHMPAWLRQASQQSLTHIMQTLQELATAVEQASAPGLPTLEQFTTRHTLKAWTRARLSERLHRATGLDVTLDDLRLTVTMARQIGPLFNPLLPSSYIPVASRPQVGETVELVSITYTLDELALLNVSWFDIDYWLTARLHRVDGSAAPEGLDAALIRRLVRELDAGANYASFLRTHLLTSTAGQWRQRAHGRINRARMRAEAVKALYAGHYLTTWPGRGYAWATCVLDYPDSAHRPCFTHAAINVHQLMIMQHTVRGVLLVAAEQGRMSGFLVYAPDAPDRRPWRHYRNARHLLRDLRDNPSLRDYVKERLPLLHAREVEALLVKGGLGPHLARPVIQGHLFDACYRAEVHALLEKVDASSNTRLELVGETALHTLWLLLDLISLVLPHRIMMPVAFGRAVVSALEGLDDLQEGDRHGAFLQLFETLSHLADGVSSAAGSSIMRRALRHIPSNPTLTLPNHYQVAPNVDRLRYRLGGIYGEGVYEKTSSIAGVTEYYVQDDEGRFYQVVFDGRRWRAVDPQLPEAYTKLPVKRLANGAWVIDSPLLWHDGLPDLTQLFEQCAVARPPQAGPLAGGVGLYQAADALYLQAGPLTLPLRQHLLPDHYHLLIPPALVGGVEAWAVLRWEDAQWRIRAHQAGRSSGWLALPAPYEPARGNS